jgi:hypothetical protein
MTFNAFNAGICILPRATTKCFTFSSHARWQLSHSKDDAESSQATGHALFMSWCARSKRKWRVNLRK